MSATHELGHAAACLHYRIRFKDVEVRRIKTPFGIAGGRIGCWVKDSVIGLHVRERYWRNVIVMLFAGDAAVQALWFHTGGATQDEKDARKIAIRRLNIPQTQVDCFLEPLRQKALTLFRKPEVVNMIDSLYSVLVEKGKLSHREIRMAYRNAKLDSIVKETEF
jgi:hypothetical protein